MARMLISWDHTIQRNFERIKPAHRKRVLDEINLIKDIQAPLEAVGHYNWYIKIYSNNKVIALLVIRGIAVRTIYSPDMSIPNGR